MKTRLAFFGTMLLGAALFAGSAQASTLVFDLPDGVGLLGSSYSQGGFTFTNSADGSPEYDAYGNWVALGYPEFNAASTPDIFTNYSGASNTITNDAGTPFNFTSIGLADPFDLGDGGEIQFTFNYASGGSSSTTVDLAAGVLGLQIFNFGEYDLTSVVFTPITTDGQWIQFDNVGLDPVPEPSSLALLGFTGLLGLAIAGVRGNVGLWNA